MGYNSFKLHTFDVLSHTNYDVHVHISQSSSAPERHAAAAGGAGAADGGDSDERAAPEAAQERGLRDPEVGVARPAGAGGVQLLQACRRV